MGIPGARLELFDGGHIFFFLRERQRFLDAVTAFLDARVGQSPVAQIIAAP